MLFIIYAIMLLIFGCVYLTHQLLWVFSITKSGTLDNLIVIGVYTLLYLLLSPLIPGFLLYCYDMNRLAVGELSGNVPAIRIFHCYRSPLTLFRAWIHTAIQAFLTGMPLGAAYFFSCLIGSFFSSQMVPPSPFFIAILFMAAILLTLAVIFLSGCLSPAFFLSTVRPTLPIFQCFRYSFLFMRSRGTEIVMLFLKFYLGCILSAFAAGIPFFLYLLPYSIFFYIVFSKELANTV